MSYMMIFILLFVATDASCWEVVRNSLFFLRKFL